MSYRISHSSIDTYNQCSYKYKLKYKDRLYSKTISSPLFFGSVMDDAFSRLLLDLKKVHTEEEALLMPKTAEEVFEEKMLPYALDPNCEYSKSDFDPILFNAQDLLDLQAFDPSISDWFMFHEECSAILEKQGRLSDEDRRSYNYLSWLSLTKKGKLLIDTYRKEVIPLINEVFDIQKEVQIENADGDFVVGKIDFSCEFKDEVGVRYICDNKTSSKAYSESSASESDQLAIYCENEKTNKSCFVVVEKKLRKKDPKVRISIIKGEIPEEEFQKTFDKVDISLDNIVNENFHKKDTQKECFFFGRQCEYIKYCWSGDTIIEGLYKKENKDEKKKS